MAVKSVLGHPTSKAKLNKTTFNLSHNFKFTSSCGHELPVFDDFAQPGDKYVIDFSCFTRSIVPLTAPAQVTFDEFIELYFVPLGRISSTAESDLTRVNDVHSSLVGERLDNNQGMNVCQIYNTKNRAGMYVALTSMDHSLYGPRFDDIVGSTYRLSEHFGYNPNNMIQLFFDSDSKFSVGSENADINVNFLPFYAYQAIYQDCIRLTNWEEVNRYCASEDYVSLTVNPTRAQNLSAFTDGKAINDPKSLSHLFTLRYRPYNRDFFKAIEPSPLFVDNSVLNTDLSDFNNWLGVVESNLSTRDGDESSSDTNEKPNKTQSYAINHFADNFDSSSSGVSVPQIKQLFAMDKLVKAIGMNPKHYDDQILARFGVKVPHDWRHEVQQIGEWHGTVNIGEVIATATTGEDNGGTLGDMAGKAYGSTGGHKVTFTAPCHGIIMALYSLVPRINYIPGLNRQRLAHNFFDFPQPELDNLGMQPQFSYELFAGNYGSQSYASITGWQARYMEYKAKPNRTTRIFNHTNMASGNLIKTGFNSDWTVSSVPLPEITSQYGIGQKVTEFLCSPTDLNNLFTTMYRNLPAQLIDSSSEWGNNYANCVYEFDPFLHDLDIKAFKQSWMSIYGLERMM